MNHPITLKPLHLLLVDDDDDLRTDMAEFFARRGNYVEQCANGQQALDLLGQKSFDVMVLDLSMPGCSVLEVLKELQDRQAECEVHRHDRDHGQRAQPLDARVGDRLAGEHARAGAERDPDRGPVADQLEAAE